MLRALEAWVPEGLRPDLTLWFDVEPALAASRRAAARAADRFEAEDLAFFERVRAGYLARMREAPGRIIRIDSARDKGEVKAQIEAALEALLGGACPAPTRRIEPTPATSPACPGWRRRCGARSKRNRRMRSSSTG